MTKRGRKAKEKKVYFGEREEQAVVNYAQTDDINEKNRIFNSILLPALTKMIESIIHRYKLFVPDEEFQQTFNDTISYLLTKINNYKPEMYVYEEYSGEPSEPPVDLTKPGFIELKKVVNEHSPKYVRVFEDIKNWPEEFSPDAQLFKIFKLELRRCKAYSYCGTVCKNYLIFRNIQYTKNKQRNMSYDELVEGMADFSKDSKYILAEEDKSFALVERLIKEMSEEIKTMLKNRDTIPLSENEIKVGIALTELLDHWEEVLNVDGSNKLQKSSVLYFLREETMMTTKEVRDNMRAYKKAYYLLKKNIIEND